MDTNEIKPESRPEQAHRAHCLVAGCPCRDARIVSQRRARFFAHLAVTNGQTAGRVVLPEPGWTIPRAV